MPDDRQHPVESPFGARSTASEIAAAANLKNKTVIVTGGYSGIGLETTRALASAGARVIVTVRSPEKAQAALDGLKVETVALDLSEPDSLETGAQALRDITPDGIDILINNAGIMATPLRRNSKGWESQFATNHLGHFALFARLSDLLLKRKGARVVALSSIAHRRAGVDLEDWNYKTGDYEKWEAYARSKTANALFALELNTRYESHGLKAYSVHPGGIATDLQRDLDMEEMRAMGWFDENDQPHPMFKTPEQGAATTLWAATSPLLAERGGVYCEDCNIADPNPPEGAFSGVQPHARDRATAQKLWTLSEEITGLKAV
jgi:NAD(P)-dependent dehydrogenase (short-subunit alcohol dehydrogenase family)